MIISYIYINIMMLLFILILLLLLGLPYYNIRFTKYLWFIAILLYYYRILLVIEYLYYSRY